MKFLRKILERKREDEHKKKVETCSKSLTNLFRGLPLDGKEQVINILKAFAHGGIKDKTENVMSFDTSAIDIQSSFLLGTKNLNDLYEAYDSLNAHPAIRLSLEADRFLAGVLFSRLKDYCTIADNSGCDMIILTGSDIASLVSSLEFCLSFLWYRHDGSYEETKDFIQVLSPFANNLDTIVIVNEKEIPSDPALDGIIEEMTRHVFVLGMGDFIDSLPEGSIDLLCRMEGDGYQIEHPWDTET